ncbi:MAG: hypothetical protein Q6353_016595 [Candidatus Sigynarchaeum springense]
MNPGFTVSKPGMIIEARQKSPGKKGPGTKMLTLIDKIEDNCIKGLNNFAEELFQKIPKLDEIDLEMSLSIQGEASILVVKTTGTVGASVKVIMKRKPGI